MLQVKTCTPLAFAGPHQRPFSSQPHAKVLCAVPCTAHAQQALRSSLPHAAPDTQVHADVSSLACSTSKDAAGETALAASRRSVLLSAAAIAAAAVQELGRPGPAAAIQGITAGRIPGVSKDADEEGFFTYQRPEGKSGGHGVGWSEIPRYSFKLPEGWEETPVSIADLGGTEIDLRYANRGQGDVIVVVAPVLRFKDVGFNADVTLEDLGPPDRLILGFAPELVGAPLPDNAVSATQVVQKGGRTYYQWEVAVAGAKKPYHYVTMTAVGNRAFLLATAATPRQWRAAKEELRTIQQSFYVPSKNTA